MKVKFWIRKLKKRLKQVPKKVLIPILTILVILAVVYFLDSLLPKWRIWKEKPKTEKKITETAAVAEKAFEKTTEKTVTTTAVQEKFETTEEKARPTRDPYTEPKIVTDYRKAKEQNQKLKAEVAKLKQQIQYLQTETEIRGPEDIEKINAKIATLNERVGYLEAEVQRYERYQAEKEPEEEYEEVYQEPYYYEPSVRTVYFPSLFYPWSWGIWYSNCYYYWRWRFYWTYYPYGYLGLYLGWHPVFGWTRPLGYYEPYYYGRRSGHYEAQVQRVLSKSQLKKRSASRYSTSQSPTSTRVASTNGRLSQSSVGKIYPSRINSKNIAKIPEKYQTRWGDSRNFGKSSSKVNSSKVRSSPRNSPRIYSSSSRSRPKGTSTISSSRAPSRSFSKPSQTTARSSGKVRKKR